MSFVHLHNHSEYSMLDGLSKVKKMAKHAAEHNMPAIALTDHGVMHGVIEFSDACNDAGVKPIIGMEAYLTKRGRRMSDRDNTFDRSPHHLLLLAMNQTGYKNLMRLATLSQLEGFYYKPRIDHDALRDNADGIICTSGCPSAEIPRLILEGKDDEARKITNWYLDVFKDRFYFEIQEHALPEFSQMNVRLIEWAKEFGVPVIATNDAHYVRREDAIPHDLMLCIQTTSLFTDPKRMRFNDDSYYLRTEAEMRALFDPICPEALVNTVELANRCDVKLKDKSFHLPHFQRPARFLSDSDYMRYLCEVGFEVRYGIPAHTDGMWVHEQQPPLVEDGFHSGAQDKSHSASAANASSGLAVARRPATQAYFGEDQPVKLTALSPLALPAADTHPAMTPRRLRERLKFEIDTINQMGFATYMLIVWDLIRFCRETGIWWDVRGSAAGSMVSHVLMLTNVEPVSNDLYFERFLNPERVTMPDIDMDFPDDQRYKLVDYTIDKYGVDKVAQIITFGTLAARASLKDIGRVLDVPLGEVNRVTQLVPAIPGKPITLKEALEQVPDLKRLYDDEAHLRELYDKAMLVEGAVRNAGTHAAGVVIADKPLIEYAPLHRLTGTPITERLNAVTQFEMNHLENIGLLKMDYLGLSMLTIIRKACELIEQRHGISYTLDNIPVHEKATYDTLSKGDVVGVFQVEGCLAADTMIDGCSIMALYEQFVLARALERPGPQFATLSCYEDQGVFELNRILDVVYSGVKPVFRLTDANGQSIKATADHRFLTQRGWVRLGELDPARDWVLRKADQAPRDLDTPPSQPLAAPVSAMPSTGALTSPMAGQGHLDLRHPAQCGAYGVSTLGAFGPTLGEDGSGLDRVGWRGPRIPPVAAARSALSRVCLAAPPAPASAYWASIRAIESIGAEDTYDIHMRSPGNNFVASGFVVHNSGMRNLMMDMKPTRFENIVAAISLYRPGPLEYIPTYIKRMHGEEPVKYHHPDLAPIFGETYGICVSGDALLFDPVTGQRYRMDEAGDVQGLHLQGVRMSAKGDDLSPAVGRVTNWVHNGRKPVFQLRLANGAQIKVTAQHKLLTLSGWMRLCDLKPGDRIATPKQLLGAGQRQPFDRVQLGTLACALALGDVRDARDARDARDVSHLTLACTAADKADERGVKCVDTIRVDPIWPIQDERAVPDFVFGLSEEDIGVFLAALWGCAGATGQAGCHYTTHSGRLAGDVQTLLLRLGIRSVVSTSRSIIPATPSGEACTAYRVTPYVTPGDGPGDRHWFAAKVQPTIDPVRPALSCAAAYSPAIARDLFAQELGAVAAPLAHLGMGNGGDRWSRAHTRLAEGAANVLDLTASTPAGAHVCWEEVITIEPAGEEAVYDLTVEGFHNFVANNIIVHNCVYQEQIMRVARDFAGYSMGEADTIRKAVSKKVKEQLDKHKSKFRDGAVKKGYPGEVADQIWADIEFFARYGFNKSHAAIYASITCQTAWLKAKYPLEYFCALLTVESGNTEKITGLIGDAKQHGIQILPPSVNASVEAFSIEALSPRASQTGGPRGLEGPFAAERQSGDKTKGSGGSGALRFGLMAIKNVGSGPVSAIIDARKISGAFKSLDDFARRVDMGTINKRALESLIKVGAFDAFGARPQLLAVVDQLIGAAATARRAAERGQGMLFGGLDKEDDAELISLPKKVKDIPKKQLLQEEKELIGTYVSEHPLQATLEALQDQVTHTSATLGPTDNGQKVRIAGVISFIRPHTTKTGKAMAFGEMEDLYGRIELTIFPRTWEEYQDILIKDQAVLIGGKAEVPEGGAAKILVERVSTSFDHARSADTDHTRAYYRDDHDGGGWNGPDEDATQAYFNALDNAPLTPPGTPVPGLAARNGLSKGGPLRGLAGPPGAGLSRDWGATPTPDLTAFDDASFVDDGEGQPLPEEGSIEADPAYSKPAAPDATAATAVHDGPDEADVVNDQTVETGADVSPDNAPSLDVRPSSVTAPLHDAADMSDAAAPETQPDALSTPDGLALASPLDLAQFATTNRHPAAQGLPPLRRSAASGPSRPRGPFEGGPSRGQGLGHAPLNVVLHRNGDARSDVDKLVATLQTLRKYEGDQPFTVTLINGGSKPTLLDFPNDTTRDCAELRAELAALLGAGCVE